MDAKFGREVNRAIDSAGNGNLPSRAKALSGGPPEPTCGTRSLVVFEKFGIIDAVVPPRDEALTNRSCARDA